MNLLNITEGDSVEVDIDLFQLASRDFVKFKRLAFDYHNLNITTPQGEAILDFMQLPRDVSFKLDAILSKTMLQRLATLFKKETELNKCMVRVVDFLEHKDVAKAAQFIEIIIPCLRPEMFVLTKKLKVVKEIKHSSGKWPETMGNGFFVDSNYIIPYLVEMAKKQDL